MVRNRKPNDARTVMSYRAIRETELFLAEYLHRPHLTPRIPIVRVGYGRFPPGLADEFWAEILERDGA